MATYLRYVNELRVTQGDKDRNGDTVNGSVKANRYAKLVQMGMNQGQARGMLTALYGYKW